MGSWEEHSRTLRTVQLRDEVCHVQSAQQREVAGFRGQETGLLVLRCGCEVSHVLSRIVIVVLCGIHTQVFGRRARIFGPRGRAVSPGHDCGLDGNAGTSDEVKE